MKKLFYLTKDGVAELEDEHKSLIGQRSDVAERIKTAREFGDLAENAEYQTARHDQEKLESRISEIEHILQNVEVIKAPKGGNGGKVQLGSVVTIKNGAVRKFQVVGTVEADPLEGKISDESPLGKAVMGKKVGDEVEIVLQAEKAVYKIIEIA